MPAERRTGKVVTDTASSGVSSLAGFRLRLFLLAALVLMPLYVLLISSVFHEYAAARDEVQNEGLRLVRLVALQQEHAVAAIRPLLTALSKLPDVASRAPSCDGFMAQLLRDNPSFGDAGVAGPDGIVY